MPLVYLRSLERDALPFRVRDMGDIEKLRVLNAAGMVGAQFVPMNLPHQTARVLCVTGLGLRRAACACAFQVKAL